MIVNKEFSDQGPNPFLINLLRKNLYGENWLSGEWSINHVFVIPSFLNGSWGLSEMDITVSIPSLLPFCPKQSLYKCHSFSLLFPFWIYLLLSYSVTAGLTISFYIREKQAKWTKMSEREIFYLILTSGNQKTNCNIKNPVSQFLLYRSFYFLHLSIADDLS